jgi:hypothetical protein
MNTSEKERSEDDCPDDELTITVGRNREQGSFFVRWTQHEVTWKFVVMSVLLAVVVQWYATGL